MNLVQNIEALCAIPGVSGREDAVRAEILKQITPLCGSCSVDPLGNILAFKQGRETPGNKILLSAHMDEVGMIVTHIDDSGLLRFSAVGGIDSRVVIGKPVEIGEKRIPGVIGTKAVHQQEEKERAEAMPLDKLFIDIGAKDADEAALYVALGDRAVFAAGFGRLGEGKIYGKALDDRAGCAMLIELMQKEIPVDCWFSFTVLEETGCQGAMTAGYTINPDIAVAIETTTASDIAGVEPDKAVCTQGRGPVISFMDRGTVYDAGLYRLALETAKRNGIPCQSKEGVFGGNEARSLQTARGGARTLAVNLPCRYLHSPTATLQVSDIEQTVQLLEALLPELGKA